MLAVADGLAKCRLSASGQVGGISLTFGHLFFSISPKLVFQLFRALDTCPARPNSS